MSGGTDSSVAAMLLKEQGYEVAGVTFRMFDKNDEEPEFISEAKKLTESLAIPHYVMDIRKEFEQSVIQHFENEYLAGRTPHPVFSATITSNGNTSLKKPMSLVSIIWQPATMRAQFIKTENILSRGEKIPIKNNHSFSGDFHKNTSNESSSR